ncbi:MAG TPA: acetylxylan esterase [Bacteroidales bacterium]
MKRNLFFVMLFALSISGLSQGITDLRQLFDYDKGEDIEFRVLSTKDTLQGSINSVIFSSTGGLKVTATLIIPKQKIREFPAVIFLNDASQDKDAFMSQALNLAGCAFAVLLIDPLPTRPEMTRILYHNFAEPRKDLIAYKQAVLDIRRAIDMLEQHPRIDRNRIAFIGSGDGAMTGAILSGIETRILTYILLDCRSSYSYLLQNSRDPLFAKARNALTEEQIKQYESIVKILNPSNYLPYHRNTQILFQFAENDPYFDGQTARDVVQFTKDPKTQKYYKTTNAGLIILEEACNDQKNWLRDHL